jgi:hypothetical protein
MVVKMDNYGTSFFIITEFLCACQEGGSQGGKAGAGQTVWRGVADRFFIYAILH